MRKVVFVLFALLIVGLGFCEETPASEVGVAAISVDAVSRGESCTVSPESINAVKEFIAEELNTGNLSFYNVTSSYCYEYGDYSSISVTVLFKEDESSITGKSVNANFYTQTTYDYNIVFSDEELNKLGYTLKDMYMKYLVNGTGEDFYVIMYSYEDCDSLRNYYNSLTGEKYFNEDSCSVVLKTSTSEIKSLGSAPADYIHYLGDTINFVFKGYSTGNYDLESLSNSINCDFNDRYYISSVDGDCHAYYNDDTLVYFSSSMNSGDDSYAYFSAYGIVGGKVEFSVSAYGLSESSVQSWVDGLMSEYFPGYSFSISFEGDEYKYYSIVERDFSFETSVLSGFKVNEYEMSISYSLGDTYVTITEPYIQVYINDYGVLDTLDVRIVPPYWGNYFVITSDKVFATATLTENDESLAAETLIKIVEDYVSVDDWVLEMTVSGGWYYPYPMPLIDGVREEGAVISGGVADSSISGASPGESSELLGLLQSESTGNLASMDVSKFEELKQEDKTILESIWDYLVNLFT